MGVENKKIQPHCHKVMKFIFATLLCCAVLHLKTVVSRPDPGTKVDDAVMKDDSLKSKLIAPRQFPGGQQGCPQGFYMAPEGMCCPSNMPGPPNPVNPVVPPNQMGNGNGWPNWGWPGKNFLLTCL